MITNSIVAGNTAGGGMSDIDPGTGAITVDYSLIGDTSGSGITGGTGTGNILDVDPMLGPLAGNGGPTQTHTLLSGSPAIDMGDPAILFNPAEFDQRGSPFARVVDGGGLRIDMGAYERQTVAANFFVVDTPVDEMDGDYSSGDVSLREPSMPPMSASAPTRSRSTPPFSLQPRRFCWDTVKLTSARRSRSMALGNSS